MEFYLLAQGYEVWDTVQNGFTSTTDEQDKNNLVNDAKENNIIIIGLIESSYHKVLGCKATKNVWDKLENIYEILPRVTIPDPITFEDPSFPKDMVPSFFSF